MHLRYSACIGLPVLDETGEISLGSISGILIHPDAGKVEGFLLSGSGSSEQGTPFFSSLDIVRWGTRVYLRHAGAVGPLEERIRLAPLLRDRRTILGQAIRSESGVKLGRCADVQFTTKSMRIEWLFPRTWFRWAVPLPVSQIVEVNDHAIIVRDPIIKSTVESDKRADALTLTDLEPTVATKAL